VSKELTEAVASIAAGTALVIAHIVNVMDRHGVPKSAVMAELSEWERLAQAQPMENDEMTLIMLRAVMDALRRGS